MTSTTLAPVKKSIVVGRSVEDAFRIFTEEIGVWWPLHTHAVATADSTTAIFEPRVGGRLFERSDDGSERTWGEVLAYESPRRLAFSWHPNPDAPAPTEVEITFTPEGNGTRVDLEHRGWERLGPEGGPRAREEYHSGWDPVLERYVEAC